jgi:hypothetical protein
MIIYIYIVFIYNIHIYIYIHDCICIYMYTCIHTYTYLLELNPLKYHKDLPDLQDDWWKCGSPSDHDSCGSAFGGLPDGYANEVSHGLVSTVYGTPKNKPPIANWGWF